MLLQFVSMLLLQALHSQISIYLNLIVRLHIFSDGLIFAKTFEDFNLMLDQLQRANTFDLV